MGFGMTSTVLAMLLLYAAPNATSESREAYARCLKDFVRKSAEAKMEPAAFNSAIATACKDKEALLKTALNRDNAATGMKAAAADKNSSEQIADYLSMAKEDYRYGFEDAAKPKQ